LSEPRYVPRSVNPGMCHGVLTRVCARRLLLSDSGLFNVRFWAIYRPILGYLLSDSGLFTGRFWAVYWSILGCLLVDSGLFMGRFWAKMVRFWAKRVDSGCSTRGAPSEREAKSD